MTIFILLRGLVGIKILVNYTDTIMYFTYDLLAWCLVGMKLNSMELEFLKFEKKHFIFWLTKNLFIKSVNSSNLRKKNSLSFFGIFFSTTFGKIIFNLIRQNYLHTSLLYFLCKGIFVFYSHYSLTIRNQANQRNQHS